jgi:tRNA pseudouridine synthase 10
MKVEDRAAEILRESYICDMCLGRQFGNLLSGYTNEQRGKAIREYLAFMIDSGEKVDADMSNFSGFEFRNAKLKAERPGKCGICKNFFTEKLDGTAKKVIDSIEGYEYSTFQIGTVVADELLKNEERLWERTNIDFVEPIKNEINRELGKLVEAMSKKDFARQNPDLTIVVNMKTGKVELDIRSLYVVGFYQKLRRGIPQTKWICNECGGKGCKSCKEMGKRYKTSVQEIIEKPFLKAAKSESSSFHGAGRADIDAREFGFRPFVIELQRPVKRTVDLKKMEKAINKSGKVRVKKLKFTSKDTITKIKFAKIDKTYFTVVDFEKPIDKKKLKLLKSLESGPIIQKTPLRVVHRRADKYRKRMVRKISWKVVGPKKMHFKIRGESGLYIKELISGDQGRTRPNVADLLENKVMKIALDVVQVHTKKLKL